MFIFFLLCEHSHLLLPTLRSRAQIIEFWEFTQKKPEKDNTKGPAEKLFSLNLAERFECAKVLAESDEDIPTVLADLLLQVRELLLASLRTNPRKLCGN